jgi:hypothetical protein
MKNSEVVYHLKDASYWITEVMSGDIEDADNKRIKYMIDAIDEAVARIGNEVDLFELPELLPNDVKFLLTDFSRTDKCGYTECSDLVIDLNKLGYTCEYGLDYTPYNLKKL